MAELTTTSKRTASSCCAPDAQATCCEPSAKADCCGHDDNCGCEAGLIRLSYGPQAPVLAGDGCLLKRLFRKPLVRPPRLRHFWDASELHRV
jgi:hypothetical protein